MPTLNWNEIKRRAIGFANNWKQFRIASFAQQGRARERAEAQTFWNEFFAVFGIDRRVVAAFEEPVKNFAGDTNFIDLFYKNKLIAEHKSPGKPLDKAHAQAMDYIQSLHREGRLPVDTRRIYRFGKRREMNGERLNDALTVVASVLRDAIR